MYVCPRVKGKIPKRDKPEIVATVPVHSLPDSENQPNPEGRCVAVQENRFEKYWHRVGKDELKWVEVFDRERHGTVVAMVELVEGLVEVVSVHEAMEPVEHRPRSL